MLSLKVYIMKCMYMVGIFCFFIVSKKMMFLKNLFLCCVFVVFVYNMGYMILVGWGVMVCLLVVYLNFDIYEDFLVFNLWSW